MTKYELIRYTSNETLKGLDYASLDVCKEHARKISIGGTLPEHAIGIDRLVIHDDYTAVDCIGYYFNGVWEVTS